MDSWKSLKAEHVRLSAAAADKYDELYENANFATGSYMRYELETVRRFAAQSPTRAVAVDLGCGTGRDSFYLAKQFDQVFGYDISPEMVLNANRNKLRGHVGNVSFEVLDVEEHSLPWGDNTVPFVNTAFGMASFVHHIETLFREVRRVLMPGGLAIFSFYNSEALVNKIQLQWKPALAARVVPGEDCLEVNFEGVSYKIAAKAYAVKDVQTRIQGAFGRNNLLEISTFPTLSALFPNELFGNEATRDLCTRVDNLLATNLDVAAGPYIVAVCKKSGRHTPPAFIKGYAAVLGLLQQHHINATQRIKAHEPVRTMEDVQQILEIGPERMIKSILICSKSGEEDQVQSHNLFLVGVTADRKVDFGEIARYLRVHRSEVSMATQLQVEEITGFEIGSIPPFGLPRNIPIILDASINSLGEVWCGTGKSTESIRLTLNELKVLTNATFHQISKPRE